jgi:membrane protein required for colicin V production
MNWADYLITIFIALSMIFGLWRGFLRAVISLASWIVAFAVASTFYRDVSEFFKPYIDIHSLRVIAAFATLFIITLLIGGLVGNLVSRLINYTGLTGTDRVLGTVFGLVRGAAIITLLVLIGGMTPLSKDNWWRQSMLLCHFQEQAIWMRDFLPIELAHNIRFN